MMKYLHLFGRLCHHLLLSLLCVFVTSHWRKVFFPAELKIANVIPLYKSNDSFVFNNYRPVSLLRVLSKVFEKVMYNRLNETLELYKIFTNSQFGFRKWHSTYMALMTHMDRMSTSADNEEHAIDIILDFAKPLILLIMWYWWTNDLIMVLGLASIIGLRVT